VPPEARDGEPDTLTLTIDGWEGPLHLLLDLARRQKVDLRKISILALVDQYLEYVERAGAQRLELAADYLVMAAWLACAQVRSCCCRAIPKCSERRRNWRCACSCRLQRLGAMREAGARLMARDRLGRDVLPARRARGPAHPSPGALALRSVRADAGLRRGPAPQSPGGPHGSCAAGDDAGSGHCKGRGTDWRSD
jgi:segregation and condensation protein A